MDRFIETKIKAIQAVFWYLKSNMDRFIVYIYNFVLGGGLYLKSNMDRFIVGLISNQLQIFSVFKIQYG